MKRILSLALSFATCFSGLVSLCAAPARAQEVASVSNIGRLREQYERLLAIDRDPSTPTEVRELNHAFLAERRAQLRDALTARIESLRKYQAGTASMLVGKEKGALDEFIRDLETQLQKLQLDTRNGAPALQPTPGRQAAPAAGPSRAARNRRAAVVPASAVTSLAEPATAQPVAHGRQTEPAPEDSGAAPKQDTTPAAPIVITSPADGASIIVDKVELEIQVNDDAIDDVTVDIYEGDSKTLACKSCERTVEIKRSNKGKKKIPVSLRKGVNRIEVTSKQKPEAKAVAKVTYATDEPVAIGSTGSGGGSPRTIQMSTTPEKWTNVPEVGDNIRVGYEGETGKLYQFFVTKRDGTQQTVGTPMTPGVGGGVSAVFPELASGDLVGVTEVENGQPVEGSRRLIAVESPLDETKGGPFGLLVGGVVMSQQAQEFQQSDPFFGFTAGYISKMRNAHRLSRRGACGNETKSYIVTNIRGLYATEDGRAVRCTNGKWVDSNQKITEIDRAAKFVRNEGFSGWRWNLRFQGVFQSDPRTATATDTATTGNGNGNGQTNDPFTFVASRKTFNMESQAWVDFYANSAFSIGPYGAIGASTVLDKNELQGEAVTAGDQDGDDDTDTVTTGARSDNDIKKYYEFGTLMNIMLNRDLFAQSILAYGNYEALSGLYNGPKDCSFCDSKKRFVGKLRIFPFGLNRGFGRQIKMAPMFGVELNAGRGPDHLKFFSGFAVRIKGINVSDVTPSARVDSGTGGTGGTDSTSGTGAGTGTGTGTGGSTPPNE